MQQSLFPPQHHELHLKPFQCRFHNRECNDDGAQLLLSLTSRLCLAFLRRAQHLCFTFGLYFAGCFQHFSLVFHYFHALGLSVVQSLCPIRLSSFCTFQRLLETSAKKPDNFLSHLRERILDYKRNLHYILSVSSLERKSLETKGILKGA